MTQGWSSPNDADVVRHARVLPLEIVQAKGSGHAGTAVSLAPALYLLFQEFLRHDPADPTWPGRDRFVLSCGHTSLSLYLQLYLSGYGLELHDLKQARKIDSRTPGHPERGHTAGVETTTGPLGQGVANAVGIAMEAQRMRRLLDTDLYSPRVWCVASDGDMEEGITHEASSLAGTLKLPGLIVVWDDNRISIEGDTAIAFAEDTARRYEAYGWKVLEIFDAEDPAEIRRIYAEACDIDDAPVFIRLHSRLGNPMPTVGGTAKAHAGGPGVDEIAATKTVLGLDPQSSFDMPEPLLQHARQVADRGRRAHAEWTQHQADWAAKHPEQAAELDRMMRRDVSPALAALADVRAAAEPLATRVASGRVLNAVAPFLPELWGGSCDLAESNGTLIEGAASFLPTEGTMGQWTGGPGGQVVHFGIREHAMGAILNGMALAGISRPFGATYLVFSDYQRPAVRLAALMKLPVTFIWSHDSIMVGEDGPTHQPIEQLWSYRAMPGLAVVRPADTVETADAWRRILTRAEDGPTALALSRQKVPIVAAATSYDNGASRGAYTVWGDSDAEALIIATGSEVSLAIEAAERLRAEGIAAKVVSAPCLEWFEAEDKDYQDQVLPPQIRARVSVEAGTDTGWYRWIGSTGRTVGINTYGASGAGEILMQRLGVTVADIMTAVRESIAQSKALATA
jgi:transketolase